MGFVALQEGLRGQLHRRIAAGNLTGVQLARKTGFTQAHISNFLNRKRGLKLRALDRVLKALGLTLYDLLDPRELALHAALPAARDGDFIDVPVVNAPAAFSPVIVREQARQMLKFRRLFLDRLRSSASGGRKDWTRFIVIQLDANEAAAMWPEASSRATLLVDRHYLSLEPYRLGKRNIYAVQINSGVLVRYAESFDSSLVLQPRDSTFPAVVLPAAIAREAIIGRVAHLGLKV